MYRDANVNKHRRFWRGFLVGICIWAVATSVAMGGGEQILPELDPNATVAAIDANVGAVEADPPVNESSSDAPQDLSGGGQIQSLTFKKDWGIRDALQFLAETYQKNIVPSPSVDGQLAFTRLREVTFDEAMDAILGEKLKYEKQGTLIRVYTSEEYKKIKEDPERMVYRIFTLYYISAAEAKKLLTPLLSDKGVVETTTAAVTDFPTGESISSVTGGGDTTAMHDTIIVHDYPENIADVNDVLRAVDHRPKQVLVEATVLSVTLTEDMQFGIDWNTLRGVVSTVSGIGRNTPDFFGFLGSGEVTKSGGLTVGFAHDNIAGFIRAVEKVTDVTILANPKILAVNKQLGQVYIGKKLGYESQTTQTEVSTTQQVEFLDTGTKLSFRPYIGDDGYIRMDIHPKDSSGTLKANNIPDEISAELVTNILVRDGQTVVIGGLFRDTVTTGRTQIPLLGDLPIVGAAFRGTADQAKREEVVVLLTPHIIEEPNETQGNARAEDIRRKRIGAKDAMQPLGRARLAEDHYGQAAKYYLEGDMKSAMEKLNTALTLRPTYLEALRLRERIIAETDPEQVEKLERVTREKVERREASKWMRR